MSEKKSNPFRDENDLIVGNNYPIIVSERESNNLVYLGRDVAFTYGCCGKGAKFGYFFYNDKRSELIVIAENELEINKPDSEILSIKTKGQETILNVTLEEIIKNNPNTRFKDQLYYRDLQSMMKNAKIY